MAITRLMQLPSPHTNARTLAVLWRAWALVAALFCINMAWMLRVGIAFDWQSATSAL